MTFEEFLRKRRIDVPAFADHDQERYEEWREMYAQMHPNSFYTAVKMVINDVRRRYWLKEAPKPVEAAGAVQLKPVVRRAMPGAAPTTPSPAAEEAKTAPVRPRPVIRRPGPEAGEEAALKEPGAEAPQLPMAPALGPAAKPPRSRPVFKRPAPAPAPEQSNEAPAPPADAPIAEPEAKSPQTRPVIPGRAVRSVEAEEATKPNTLPPLPDPEAKPKPLRPRPVIPGRAAKADAEPPKPSVPEGQPVPPAAPPPDQQATPPAKPPRPRPVFRRIDKQASPEDGSPPDA